MPHDREVRAAELICERFGLEQMRFTNSGSEATMHALRMCRAYTKRNKVVKFEGGYHGGHDTVLVSVKPPREKVGDPHRPSAVTVGARHPGAVRGEHAGRPVERRAPRARPAASATRTTWRR